jgi:hypothetical protein
MACPQARRRQRMPHRVSGAGFDFCWLANRIHNSHLSHNVGPAPLEGFRHGVCLMENGQGAVAIPVRRVLSNFSPAHGGTAARALEAGVERLLEDGLRIRSRVRGGSSLAAKTAEIRRRYQSAKDHSNHKNDGDNGDLAAQTAGRRLSRLKRAGWYRRRRWWWRRHGVSKGCFKRVSAADAKLPAVTVDRTAWARPGHKPSIGRIIPCPHGIVTIQ